MIEVCSLFKKKLNGLINRLGLHLKNLLSAQQDRAPTNKTCLREITETFPDTKTTNNFCCTHGLNNSGKQILGKNGSVKYARNFKNSGRKLFNIQVRQDREPK